MKIRFVEFYLRLARECSKMSYAKRLQVGALVVKDDNILSFSWNGTPRGWDNNCESEENTTLDTVIHAEENVISKAARLGGGLDGSIMFITHAPCIKCARGIIQAGIKQVYYLEDYRDMQGVNFLIDGGVEVRKWPLLRE